MKKVIVCLAFLCLLTGTAVVKTTKRPKSLSVDALSHFESKLDSFHVATKHLESATVKLDNVLN